MDSFFSFLENVATSELQNRQEIRLAETNAEIMAAQNGALYREGQPVMGGLPSWVLPAALLIGGGLVVYAVLK